MVPSGGTTGRMLLIPGIDLKDDKEMARDVTPSEQDWANFSNSQEAWNYTWDIPKGRVWNGRYWVSRGDRKRTVTMGERVVSKLTTTPKAEMNAKVWTVRAASCDNVDESDNAKRPIPRQMSELVCYVCETEGHFARQCPNEETKARNDAYLVSRGQSTGKAENESQAP
ncbi:LOW QUALITY PROTEIN: Hypothetical protein PHPALM_12212 [Phytophthora palmivora]|uniref:CCHC-type domain-containing protein n=1 Tax=Phytophthora palmivora TaxID=4796 RepID=A0A2P4Y0A1_9STRA|nr:LOW QUALITY PROTEIN: Hypothetical protein PHPALM_12212 [Phytophthora palmivora]